MVPEEFHVLLLIFAPFFGYCFILGAVESIVDVPFVHPAKIFKNMKHFSVEFFVAEPTLSLLSSLKKPQLIEITNHYELSVTGSIKKGEIKRLIMVYLTNEELAPEEDTDSLPATVGSSTLELKHLEFQERKKARAAKLKMREQELREKELLIQLRMRELEAPAPRRESSPVEHPLTRPASFDVSRHIPPFQEREADKYLLHFEKIVTSSEWPREVWMLLLQSVLVEKAREIYSAMSLEQSSQYEVVKKVILKAYELVPEVRI